MTTLSRSLTLVSGLSVALTGTALADDREGDVFARTRPAADRAVEVSVQGGYSQGVGDLGGGLGSLEDLTSAGGGGELKLGYRIIPNLTVGAYGSLSGYALGDDLADTGVIGATAGVFADWHFRPRHAVDPWIELGTGWRGLWLSPDDDMKTTSLQGFELARAQVGVDYRVSREIAISPVIGASLSMFAWEDSPATMDHTEIDGKEANLYVFGGLQGRFSLR